MSHLKQYKCSQKLSVIHNFQEQSGSESMFYLVADCYVSRNWGYRGKSGGYFIILYRPVGVLCLCH